MIGNETGPLLDFVYLSSKAISRNETEHMVRREVAASLLKFRAKILIQYKVSIKQN